MATFSAIYICTNQRHKCCILSMQQSEMLLCALNLVFFILGFAIYLVAYGVGFTLQGLLDNQCYPYI